MKKTKFALMQSVIALLLCMSMLVGTTFAWFTDSVTSGNNIIAAGNLDIELEYLDGDTWKKVNESTNVFKNDTLWEPGHTEVVYLKVSNAGTLALKYQLGVNIAKEVGSVNQAGESFLLSDYIYFGAVEGVSQAYADRAAARAAVTVVDKLSAGYTKTGTMEKGAEPQYVALVVYMPEETGNAANYATGATPPSIDLGIALTATQMTAEADSFGSDYDSTAQFPTLSQPLSVTANVQVDANGCVAAAVSMTDSEGLVTAQIPAGVKLAAGVTQLTLRITEMETSGANLTLEENEIQRSLDVHIEGIAPDNTVPVEITIGKAMMVGLNIGNYTLYHVENGQSNPMTAVAAISDLANHNDFYYDPATGDVTVCLATFSEVAMIAGEVKWEGKRDYTWYDASKIELVIANADQLAGFGAIVGGMAEGIGRDPFEGKTVKLIADINLGDAEKENNPDIIFYPIGYYNSEGTYERTNTAITSGLRIFAGTFDGNGHTISNFYQNTWEMKGDHDWYTPEEQYYRDGMGLFGRVYGGTVKNLTVRNFKSDGEIATTGVIAAYADGATFENIAIFDCNPRVYNIGNGGIVGCVGWYAKEADLETTFKNITVDNSNKISALWGSYDVACGGILGQYYPTSGQSAANYPKNAGIHFENCHISAQMDVYNDVCANYQYYAYRYTGMLIGSIRENETIDGHVYPKMDGITASGCTVHFGTWNDYYYCELVDNTTASYTHDYQMSRLTEIKAIDGTTITYLDGTTGTVPASGRANYVIVDYSKGHGTENATCYHFKDGAVWTHDMGGIQTGIDENGDGQDDLKEDKQHIYLEFNNLFTGYGWGVTSKGLTDFDGVENMDITSGDHEKSVEKFEGKETELSNNKTYKLGDIFSFVDKGVELIPGALSVAVTNLDENNPVSATIVYDRENWENGTITLTGIGKVTITIQDYYFCTPTTITVNVTERQPEEKFDVVMNNGDFLHRVGNKGTVALDKLFKAKKNVSVGTVSVNVEAVNGTGASGTYSDNAIKFNGTGVVKVTVTDNDYCIPTELFLEVVDATNVTGATNATANNVVLLNDCGFNSLEVSGGYTLYGNGFTMTCGSDFVSNSFGEFVKLDNGTLDNVQIVCPNYDYAALYVTSQLQNTAKNRYETDEKGMTRYYNARSAVVASGNSQILNSRISGGRAAVYASNGNLVIDNSRLEGGAVATVLISAANSVVFRDITLIQKPTASTYDSNKVLMGMSVLYLCNEDGSATQTTLEGGFVQYAWADASTGNYMPEGTSSIASTVLGKTNFTHTINGKSSVNLGFAYMSGGNSVSKPQNIQDSRTNKDSVPYAYEQVKATVAVTGINKEISTYVYSYTNDKGTDTALKTESTYVPNKYSDIVAVSYADESEGLTSEKSYGVAGWVFKLNVDLDKASGYKLDFGKLSMSVNGVTVTDFKVNGNTKPTNPVAVTVGGTTYTLVATIDGKEYIASYVVTGVETSKDAPVLIDQIGGTNIAADKVSWGASKCVVRKADDGNTNYTVTAPVLVGLYVRYWSVSQSKYVDLQLTTLTPANSTALNGTNRYWEYADPNGDFTLTVTNTAYVHDNNKKYAMPVSYNGALYFVSSAADGLVSTGSGARQLKMEYVFSDNNGGELKFEHTWSQAYDKNNTIKYKDLTGIADGCVAPGTLITLADGTKVPVETLTGKEELLVWNLETGSFDSAPIMFVDNEEETEMEVVHLYFSDGTEVEVIGEHGFWDVGMNRYIYLDRNAAKYIGHTFVKQGNTKLAQVQLVDVVLETKVTTAWSPVTVGHLCYFVNGMLSMPGGVGGLFNIFEVDEALMAYDEAAMLNDIEKYGLFTYEELNAIAPLSEDMFNAAGGAYLKISIGKGNLTMEELIYMINRYSKYFQ